MKNEKKKLEKKGEEKEENKQRLITQQIWRITDKTNVNYYYNKMKLYKRQNQILTNGNKT